MSSLDSLSGYSSRAWTYERMARYWSQIWLVGRSILSIQIYPPPSRSMNLTARLKLGEMRWEGELWHGMITKALVEDPMIEDVFYTPVGTYMKAKT